MAAIPEAPILETGERQLSAEQQTIHEARAFVAKIRKELIYVSPIGISKDSLTKEDLRDCLRDVETVMRKTAEELHSALREDGEPDPEDYIAVFQKRVKAFFRSLHHLLWSQPQSDNYRYIRDDKRQVIEILFGDFLWLRRILDNAKYAGDLLPFSSAEDMMRVYGRKEWQGRLPQDTILLREAVHGKRTDPFGWLEKNAANKKALETARWKPKNFKPNQAMIKYFLLRHTNPLEALKKVDRIIGELLQDPAISKTYKEKKRFFLESAVVDQKEGAKEYLLNVERACQTVTMYAGRTLPRGITPDTIFRLVVKQKGDTRASVKAYEPLESVVADLWKNPWVSAAFSKSPSRVGYIAVTCNGDYEKNLEKCFCKQEKIPEQLFDDLAELLVNMSRRGRKRDGKRIISMETIKSVFRRSEITLDGTPDATLEKVANTFGFTIIEIALQSPPASLH